MQAGMVAILGDFENDGLDSGTGDSHLLVSRLMINWAADLASGVTFNSWFSKVG
jgi:hypothetical protein